MKTEQAEPETERWYVARTHFGQEIKIKKKLESLEIGHFIPVETRKNYRGQAKEHPLIPSLIFIRASKQLACALRTDFQLPVNYLFDHASHQMMVVSDKEMEDFQRVLNHSREEGEMNREGLVNVLLEPGDPVKVIKGPLTGVEGIVSESDGNTYIGVTLLGEFWVRAKVPKAYLEVLKQ